MNTETAQKFATEYSAEPATEAVGNLLSWLDPRANIQLLLTKELIDRPSLHLNHGISLNEF